MWGVQKGITLTLGVLLIIVTSLPAPYRELKQMSLWEMFKSPYHINVVVKQYDVINTYCEWGKSLTFSVFQKAKSLSSQYHESKKIVYEKSLGAHSTKILL